MPTVLIAGLNLRIIVVYRRSCAKRRQMTLARNNLKDEDPRKFAEERRLILLLGKYKEMAFDILFYKLYIINSFL